MKPDRITPAPHWPQTGQAIGPARDCPRWAPYAFLISFLFYPALFLLLLL